MSTPVTNFALVTVSTGYAAGDLSIALATGHGSRLPSTFPFPLIWWDADSFPNPADDPNREIVICTNKVGDTLTITRAAEGTIASAKNTAGKTYKMVEAITAAMWAELNSRALTQSHRGLRVMTNPNSNADQHKVLFSADAIVMDDGEEVSGWSNLNADITVSGLNGLDTGTEQASAWYELWALYNGTTKGCVLHRAKDYLLDVDYSAGEDASQGLRSAVDNSTIKVAQSFQLLTAGPVEFIDVKLLKTGAPTGNFWFTIETNNGGAPSGTVLATSDLYDVSRLIITAQWVRIPFRTPASLSAATTYHLVLQGDYTVSASNFMSWRMDGSAAAYAGGNKLLFDSDAGGVWTADTDDDLMVRIYVTRNDTAVSLPAGYTKKAFLGYVYNDSGSNFRPFHQIGRTVFCGYSPDWRITSSFTTTTSTLVDARAFLPPRALMLQVQGYNATGTTCVIGNIRATDIPLSGGLALTDGSPGSMAWNIAANNTVAPAAIVLDEFCGFTLMTAGGTLSLWVVSFEF